MNKDIAHFVIFYKDNMIYTDLNKEDRLVMYEYLIKGNQKEFLEVVQGKNIEESPFGVIHSIKGSGYEIGPL